MQQFPTQKSSTTSLVVAAVGVGALVAYALSSPRRRAVLAAAGESAVDAGSRLATTSAEQAQNAVRRLTAKARNISESVTSAAAGEFRDAADGASELMQEAMAVARRLPAEARRASRERWREISESVDHALGGGTVGRPSAREVIIAAAAVGACVYVIQRYGGIEYVRQMLQADGKNQRDKLEGSMKNSTEQQPED